MEEQFNKEAKEGWRCAADAARITDEKAGSEDRTRTSGGVFIAVDSNLGAVVGEEEGTVASIPGNEGRSTQAWVDVQGGIRVFSVYLWHSEGWTLRNEALLEAVLNRARVTKHSWLVACDANTSPAEFEKKKKNLGSRGTGCMWWPRKVYPRAGHTALKTCGSKERMTMSSRVVVSKEKSYKWHWLKILSQDQMRQYLLW